MSDDLLTRQISAWIERYLDDTLADDPATCLIQRAHAEAAYHRSRHNPAYADGMLEVATWFAELFKAYRTQPISYRLASQLTGITPGAVRNKVSDGSWIGGDGVVLLGSITLPPKPAPDTHSVVALDRARAAKQTAKNQETDEREGRAAVRERAQQKFARKAG